MKTKRRRTVMIGGVRYYMERPPLCSQCFFWKNRRTGCILGAGNCYYLAEPVLTDQEKDCGTCPYVRTRACVAALCFKAEEKLLAERRSRAVRDMMQKEGDEHV